MTILPYQEQNEAEILWVMGDVVSLLHARIERHVLRVCFIAADKQARDLGIAFHGVMPQRARNEAKVAAVAPREMLRRE